MSSLPIWSTVLTSGAVGALMTLFVSRFVIGPRAELRLAPSTALVDDMERVTRHNEGNFTGTLWIPAGWVRLTNHGDGTAHDVKLTGERCRPRVWIGDSGSKPSAGQPVETQYPLWSDTIAALEAGESVNVCIVARNDASEAKPTVTAKWPRLAGRRWAGSRSIIFDCATARRVEHGMPGQSELGGV